jgi:TonB-dependent starch-binding outer membrane protein SusC
MDILFILKMKAKKYFFLICLLCLSISAAGQDATSKSDKKSSITGKVITKDRKAVEGAVIYIDDISTGKKSKKDGSFKIKAGSSANKIKAKSSEYGSCEKEINSQNNIELILDGIAVDLSVRAADNFNKEKAQDSIKKLNKTKPKKIVTYNNIYQMIRAEVPGVIISGRSIQIQQGHSFLGSSEPLLVVNGVIVNSIDNINPVEVKSINVLKGTAASIYGLQGSNGVLSITLKNGTERDN